MKNITSNEMMFVLTLLKNPKTGYNANNISKHIGISSMGALKIAKKLEKEKIIFSKELGKAKFYSLNFDNDYTKHYLKFLLKREDEHSLPYVKRWLNELKKIKNADIVILFGSVLTKHENARDIDVLLVTDGKRINKLKKEIEKIDFLNTKKIHPLYQSKQDLINNIKKEDKVVLNAINGVVVFGEENFIDIIRK